MDFDDLGGNVEAAHGVGEAIIVSEDDDLAVLGALVENPSESVDAGGVHRLHQIIDDEKKEAMSVPAPPVAPKRQKDTVMGEVSYRGTRPI